MWSPKVGAYVIGRDTLASFKHQAVTHIDWALRGTLAAPSRRINRGDVFFRETIALAR